jgi:ABC-2 type transport system ATP-binding protein
MPAILVENLCKSFQTRRTEKKGVAALFARGEIVETTAVSGVSFAIERGERVAFIGPNGAGKSTTLKMLTGILYPNSGRAEVAGFVPWDQRRKLAYRIGIVFGQRSQLWHHLPVRESFGLLRRIYGVSAEAYEQRREKLVHVFDIGAFFDKPAAQLSLGQRIRCEVAAALLHAPEVLLLDEPSIGLDVTAKSALRDHLTELSREEGTTVLLTSHDTGDIEHICERVIVIDHGRVIRDQALANLRREFMQHRTVILVTGEEHPDLALDGVAVAVREPYRLTLAVDTEVTSVEKVIGAALHRLSVRDLVIENAPLEDVVKSIYGRRFDGGGGHATH